MNAPPSLLGLLKHWLSLGYLEQERVHRAQL